MIVPVILSGGAGTRLWPLSRDNHPKQLLPLVSEHSLLQDTALRLDALTVELAASIVICNESHGAQIAEQLSDISHSVAQLVYEPEGRNTAPAAAVAALLAERHHAGEDPILLILPADHVITNTEAFAAAAAVALSAAEQGYVVTFGVVPDLPETGYGYIERGAKRGDFYEIESFAEKPDRERAQGYISTGNYYWNSGIFMFKAATYLAELENFTPEILRACHSAVEDALERDRHIELGREAFLACPNDSIDYAILERTRKAAVVPLDAGWSDVGSWASLHAVCDQDDAGNVCIGNTLTLDCKHSYLRAEKRLVVGIGLNEFIVVDTPEALLIVPKTRAQDVKKIVSLLREQSKAVVKQRLDGRR